MRPFYARSPLGRIRTRTTRVRICLSRCPRTGSWTTFTGVVTTGIYCRPGCSGNAARAQHAAVHVGRRGRGRGLPAVPALPPRSRARRRVGSTRPSSCAARCAPSPTARSTTRPRTRSPPRLGVSARHLRRLFDVHVGATPAEVARSRRAHFARRLLDDTDLPARPGRDRGRVQQRAPVQPGDEGRLPLHARRSCAPAAARPIGSSPTAGSSCACPTARRSRGRRCSRSSRRARCPGVETIDLDGGRVPARRRARRRARRHRGVGRARARRAAAARAPARRSTAWSTCSRACAGSSISTPTRPSSTPPSPATGRCDRWCAPAAASGCPARSTRSRSSVRAVLGQQVSVAGRDDARRPARRALRHAGRRASRALGLTHLFPDAGDPRRGRSHRGRADPGPGPDRQRARRGGRDRRPRARTAPATSTTRSPSCRPCPDSGPGPRNTSRCGRAASATRSPRPISGLRRALGDDADGAGRGLATVAGLRRDPGLARTRRRNSVRRGRVELERTRVEERSVVSRVFPGQT